MGWLGTPMRHVRNRSCGCEVNMLDARSLHTETKGSNSPSPPQTGGPKVDEPRPRLASTLSRISHASARALCIARSSARLLDQQREAECMRHKASTGPLARRCCRSSCRAVSPLRNVRRSGASWQRFAGNDRFLLKLKKNVLRLRTAGQHLPRGGVNTFEHLYGCGVNR